MKRSLKIFGTTFLLLGLVGIGALSLRTFKKFGKKENERVSSSMTDDVVEESEEKKEEKIDLRKDPENLVVKLFESLDREPTMSGGYYWDRDLIKESIFLESGSVIHVSQSVTFGKKSFRFLFRNSRRHILRKIRSSKICRLYSAP